MAFELYGMLAGSVSSATGENIKPAYGGEKEAFLRKVVTPIYNTIEKLDRVCAITSQFCGNNPMQAHGQGHLPPLMTSNLNLDMNIYPTPYDQEGMPDCNDHMMQINPLMVPEGHNFAAANGLIIMDEEKPIAADYALSFMNEVVKMCRLGEPLWIPVNDAGKEVLNFEEHAKMFPSPLTRKSDLNGLSFEASRASTVVIINSITLVVAFLEP